MYKLFTRLHLLAEFSGRVNWPSEAGGRNWYISFNHHTGLFIIRDACRIQEGCCFVPYFTSKQAAEDALLTLSQDEQDSIVGNCAYGLITKGKDGT